MAMAPTQIGNKMKLTNFEYKDVIITYDEPNEEPVEVTVVIGDGNTLFDEDFPMDARVYFYFHDEKEYRQAFENDGILPEFGFRIVKEIE